MRDLCIFSRAAQKQQSYEEDGVSLERAPLISPASSYPRNGCFPKYPADCKGKSSQLQDVIASSRGEDHPLGDSYCLVWCKVRKDVGEQRLIIANRMQPLRCWSWMLLCLLLVVGSSDECMTAATDQTSCAGCFPELAMLFYNDHCIYCSDAPDATVCSSCPSHVYLEGNCTNCYANTNTAVCSSCPNFFFDTATQLCSTCASAASTDCTTCPAHTYDWANSLCRPCHEVTDQTTCANCTDFYFGEASCSPCANASAANCATCVHFIYQPAQEVCWSCLAPLSGVCPCPDYVLSDDGKECLPCVLASSATCDQCPGFILDGENCTSCATTTSSVSCRNCPAYFYDNDRLICTACSKAKTELTCADCPNFVFIPDETPVSLFEEAQGEADGFSLGEWGFETLASNNTSGGNGTNGNGSNGTNGTGKCMACASLTTEANCRLCPNYAFLNSSSCVECAKTDASGCASCPFHQFVNNSCVTCGDAFLNETCACLGYFFNGSLCLPCGQADQPQCALCPSNYYDNDTCLKCAEAGPDTCSNCTGYVYVNACIKCEAATELECLSCSAYGWADACLSCSSLPVANCSNTLSCVVVGSSCSACGLANATHCKLCPGFAMMGSQCSSCRLAKTQAECNLCSGYFFLDGSCQPCDEATSDSSCALCPTHAFTNGSCLACSASAAACALCPSSVFSNNSCLSCANANASLCAHCPGFFFSAACHSCDHAATAADCASCGAPWSTSANCKATDNCTTLANCSVCNSSSCLRCDTGFHLLPWGCEVAPCSIAYCWMCSGKNYCYACYDGFQLNPDSTACVVRTCSVPQCQICANSTACSACEDGYHLSSDGRTCPPDCSVPNCLTCSATNTCSACAPTYQLTNAACIPLCGIANCLACGSLTTCDSCGDGYELSQSATACLVSCDIDFCQECDTRTTCLICEDYFTLTSTGQCEVSLCPVSRCKTCLNETNCSACYPGYALTAGTDCSPACSIAKCVSCLDATHCRTCSLDSTLNPNKTACSSGCGLANCLFCLTGSICGICRTGYHTVVTGNCTANCGVSYCLECSAGGVCSSCMEGFSLLASGTYCYPQCGWQAMPLNGSCVGCSQAIDGCFSCYPQAAEAICADCLPGYLLANNECIACPLLIDGCFLCNSPLLCQQCAPGYVLTAAGYRCSPLLDACPANCRLCTNSSACLQCQWGFTLNATTCVASSLQTCPSNLILNGSSCVCAPGSYLKGVSCASCTDNCLACTTFACSACTTAYYLNEGACSRCSEHCLDCASSAWCRQCAWSFTAIEGKCVYVGGDSALANTGEGLLSCPAGCGQCAVGSNGQLACLRPQAGSTYDKSGSLTLCANICSACAIGSPAVCTACYSGYRLSASTCQPCADSKCLACAVDAKVCTQCGQGYAPNSKGVCQTCTANCLSCAVSGPGSCDPSRCQSGYVQSLGQSACLKCLKGCSQCDSLDLRNCNTCSTRFYKSNNTCLPCISGCSLCSDNATCTACLSSHRLTTAAACEPLPEYPCLANTGSVCSSCAAGFQVAAGSCVVKISCNSTSTCSYCPASTYLKGKNCLTCVMPANCKTCFSNGTGCAQCRQGFYSSGSACLPCSAGCRSCSSASSCIQAVSGYFLESIWGAPTGKALACSPMCAECEGSAENCLSCPTGFDQHGSDCLNSKRTTIQLVLQPTMAGWIDARTSARQHQLILSRWPELQAYLQGLAGSQSMAGIHMTGYSFGSLIMDAAASSQPGSIPNELYSSIKLNLAANPSTSSFTLLQNSITAEGFSPEGESRANLGLILGISVPIVILLVLFIIVLNKKIRTQHQKKATAGDPNLPPSSAQLPSVDTHTEREMNKDEIQTL